MKQLTSKLAACLVIAPLCGAAVGSDAPMTLNAEALDAVTAGGVPAIQQDCWSTRCAGMIFIRDGAYAFSFNLPNLSNPSTGYTFRWPQATTASSLTVFPISPRSVPSEPPSSAPGDTSSRPRYVSAAALLLGR
ncbi:MAG: hypothetical protein KDI82_06305 [Gammaproteobacteria bacterium]|nr:hypothetical protein [Gammaproteobacteria bacterium]